MSPWPFLQHEGVMAVAHRGGAEEWPENSMRAFQHAYDLGFRYLETDVHTTRDGVMIAFHDEALDRVTDHTGLIREMTWAEVSEARIAGTDPIPRFSDLIEAFPDARFNIDCKHDSSIDHLVSALSHMNLFARSCIGAFSDRRLSRLRQLGGPKLCTSLGPRAIAQLRVASYGPPVPVPKAGAAQVPLEDRGIRIVDERFIATAHKRGLAVHVWTIDDPDEMARLIELGVDGIMTDRPSVLREVLEQHDLW
ncbi:MAG: glycerophosphodiester phosphodiesterase [Acidimicrobiales bacterium]|nr:glycerophosphodiester phosphodiesterase [Acidimicrobiales bacterium]